MRPDDQARAHIQHPPRHGLLGGLLAQRLERPVGLAVDLLDALVGQRADRALLVDADDAEVGVDRDAGDKRVVVDRAGQRLGRGPHDPRHIAAGVDRRIPAPPCQRRKIRRAIAAQFLDLRE